MLNDAFQGTDERNRASGSRGPASTERGSTQQRRTPKGNWQHQPQGGDLKRGARGVLQGTLRNHLQKDLQRAQEKMPRPSRPRTTRLVPQRQ